MQIPVQVTNEGLEANVWIREIGIFGLDISGNEISSLRCRRVFVPVHCSHSGTGGRFGRLIILWNIRPQAKNQIRRNHLSQGRRQGVALGVAFQAVCKN